MAYCFDCRHFFLDEFIIVIIRIALMRKQYLGLSGYNKIKKNQLKRNDLKKHNKAEYNRLAIKLNHFDEISDMLKAGKFIKFYQYRTRPLSTIVADFMVCQDRKNYILHLFLKQERKGSDQYNPVSFIVRSENDKNKDQYIAGQEFKKITGFEIVELKQIEQIV